MGLSGHCTSHHGGVAAVGGGGMNDRPRLPTYAGQNLPQNYDVQACEFPSVGFPCFVSSHCPGFDDGLGDKLQPCCSPLFCWWSGFSVSYTPQAPETALS